MKLIFVGMFIAVFVQLGKFPRERKLKTLPRLD